MSAEATPTLVDLPAPAVAYADALFNDVAELVDATANLLDRLDGLRGFLGAITWNCGDEERWEGLRAATHIAQVERLFQFCARLIESAPMGHGSAEGLPDRLDSGEAYRIRGEAREKVGIKAPFSWGWSTGASAWADVEDSPWPAQ